ncbi:MAG TPA: hypothetical protein PKY82_11705 [Pyrinomonadaceae bacterium]|nr:hypothetical protein [Pyrinomonadaceae bacterium]
MRINGIGLTFLSVSAPDENGISFATTWFTFVYLPIFPIRRKRVRFLPHKGSGFSYQFISDEKLDLSAVLKTFLFGWILYPLMLVSPAIFAHKSIWQIFNLPESIHIGYIIFSVIWLVVSGWKLMDWHELKYRPAKN